ncbi:hypothetical protein JCM8202_003400 [Rhodotorula sphaerocarpa]
MATTATTDGGLATERPSNDALLANWWTYFADPMLSLASLRQEALEGTVARRRGLRSLAWRFFFDLLPLPSPLPSTPGSTSSSSTFGTYSLLLSQSRSSYSALRERYLRAPDGRWVQDEDSPQGPPVPEKGSGPAGAPRLAKVQVKGNNPLGLEEENPWISWFEDLELRKVIRQDVLRTFPEVDYFRSAPVQHRLTDLLFIFCKLTPQIGYRQGMHELLAPILWLVDYDSLEPTDDEASLPHLTLSREHVEHDTWALFSCLMKSAKTFYDHSASASSPNAASMRSGSSPGPQVQPVIAAAQNIHSILQSVDPDLHAAFGRMQVDPQLYAIRWLRLLFSREFPLSDTLLLWDGLFARDTSLQLTSHVAIAMLLRVRNALLHAAEEGYGDFVQILLRYPACDDGQFRTPLLVQQAVYLRDNLSPSAVRHILKENDAMKASIGEPFVDTNGGTGLFAGDSRLSATPQIPQGLGFLEKNGLVGDLAKGVYGRAEALGINKALKGTFDEIKRTVAEAQAQAEERRRANAFSQIPARPPWDPQRSPPPPPVADKDTLANLASMRAASLAMSDAVDLCVTVLERTLAPPEREESATAPERRAPPAAADNASQMMALTALRHVRDVLGGNAPTFDPSVLQPLRDLAPRTPSTNVPAANRINLEEVRRSDHPRPEAEPTRPPEDDRQDGERPLPPTRPFAEPPRSLPPSPSRPDATSPVPSPRPQASPVPAGQSRQKQDAAPRPQLDPLGAL